MRFVIATLLFNILFLEIFIVLGASEDTGKPVKQPNEHVIHAPVPRKAHNINLIEELEEDAKAHQNTLAQQRQNWIPPQYEAARRAQQIFQQKKSGGRGTSQLGFSKEAGPSTSSKEIYQPFKPYPKKSGLHKQIGPSKNTKN